MQNLFNIFLLNLRAVINFGFLMSAEGLAGYSHVWLIFIFHENHSKVSKCFYVLPLQIQIN